MQIESLRYFVKLAQVGSFYAASKELFISQQGLSKAISSLEENVGLALFERSHKGVSLTRAGEVVLERAQVLLQDYDALLDNLIVHDRAAEPTTTRVHVRATYYGMQTMDAFGEEMKMGRVSASECSFNEIVRCLEDPNCSDVLLAELYPSTEKKLLAKTGVMFTPLVKSVFGVMWREGGGVSIPRNTRFSDIAGIPCARVSSRDFNMAYKALSNQGPGLDIRLETPSVHRLFKFVNQNPGSVALIDSFGFYICQSDPSFFGIDLRFSPFREEEAHFKLGLLSSTRAKQSELLRRSQQRLADYAQRTYQVYETAYGL